MPYLVLAHNTYNHNPLHPGRNIARYFFSNYDCYSILMSDYSSVRSIVISPTTIESFTPADPQTLEHQIFTFSIDQDMSIYLDNEIPTLPGILPPPEFTTTYDVHQLLNLVSQSPSDYLIVRHTYNPSTDSVTHSEVTVDQITTLYPQHFPLKGSPKDVSSSSLS